MNFAVKPDMIYIGDNGRAICGAHLGATASTTGLDLSGAPIVPMHPKQVLIAMAEYRWRPACERCGKQAAMV